MYEYIRAPSAVIETRLIFEMKAAAMHYKVALGLNSHPMTVALHHSVRPGQTEFRLKFLETLEIYEYIYMYIYIH